MRGISEAVQKLMNSIKIKSITPKGELNKVYMIVIQAKYLIENDSFLLDSRD